MDIKEVRELGIPYFAMELTEEQAKVLRLTNRIEWYEVDGQRVFQIYDQNGPTGKYVAYILFSPG